MTTLHNETTISAATAGRKYPGAKGAASIAPSTIIRWITRGVRTSDGRIVRLEAFRLGHRWLTSEEAIQRFAASLSSTQIDQISYGSPTQRTADDFAAVRSLKARGIEIKDVQEKERSSFPAARRNAAKT